MSPLPAALPPLDLATTTVAYATHSTGPSLSDFSVAATERVWTDYTIAAGDTLYDIAEQFGTTVPALVQRNTLAHGGRWLMPGQRLLVPGSEATQGGASTASDPGASTNTGAGKDSTRSRASARVTVRPGDTLSEIAVRNGVSVTELARANGISNPRLIYPGQRLSIPGAASRATATATSSPAAAGTVTVRSGDTLSGIAVRHSVSLSALQQANPELDPRRLWVGQKVVVPGSAASASATSTSVSTTSTTPSGPWTEDTIGDRHADKDVEDTFLHYTYSSGIARSAAANRDYLAGVPVPSRDRTKSMIIETARRHGVDPALMLALSYQESGWNQRAVSPANAIGIMQVIPTSGEWASALVGRKLNLLDPQDNVTAGTAIMRALQRSAKTQPEAIGGYYQGLASVQSRGLFADTEHYIESVQTLRDRMG
ncbi:MAG: LysM peptidoglycan-binding domain-containing protein [Actinobacteria bacterium]|nr:LysM peptidoglycan-binding domain-containing protein [Actinomycetota bacterium]